MSDKPKIHGYCAAGCAWETVHMSDFMKSASYVKRSLNNGAGVMEIGTKYRIKSATQYSGLTNKNTTETAAVLLMSASAAAAVGKRIYLFGCERNIGNSSTSSPEEIAAGEVIRYYDTETGEIVVCEATNTWANRRMAAAAVGTKIYLFGGMREAYFDGVGTHRSVDTICIYDTETDTLTKNETTLIEAANGMTACAVGTKIYITKGTGNYNYCFDTVSGELDSVMKDDNYGCGVAALGDNIYRFGGRDNSDNVTDTISRVNIATWGINDGAGYLPYALDKVSAVTVGDKIYLFGGIKTDGTYNRNILVYDPVEKTVTEAGATITDAENSCAVGVGQNTYIFGGKDDNGYFASIDTYIPVTGYKAMVTLVQNGHGVYTFPIMTYDKYRDIFYFELLAVADEGAVYEINGERFIANIDGISTDPADLSLRISGATELFINNPDAMISASPAEVSVVSVELKAVE